MNIESVVLPQTLIENCSPTLGLQVTPNYRVINAITFIESLSLLKLFWNSKMIFSNIFVKSFLYVNAKFFKYLLFICFKRNCFFPPTKERHFWDNDGKGSLKPIFGGNCRWKMISRLQSDFLLYPVIIFIIFIIITFTKK